MGHRTGLAGPPALQCRHDLDIAKTDDTGGQQGCIDRAGPSYRERAHRDTGRHLDNGKKTVLALERRTFDRHAQHRLREKEFFRQLGIGTANHQSITSEADIAAATTLPGILKTCTEGYDGKGQVRVADRAALAAGWQKLGKRDCILEALVDFLCEISVIVARGLDGATRYFPIGLNHHRDGILRATTVPSGLPAGTLATAERFGTELACGLDLVGLVALEMFVTRDGRVLANEMAPRPHNSGHWTIDACATSQFEQLVRAICGLPLGPVEVLAPSRMENLIGEEANDWARYLADPTARLHLYGKTSPRPGRKMGHVTFLKPS